MLGAALAAVFARADERSVADFKELLPERVMLSVPHGAVIRRGPLYRFDFKKAPMLEAIEAVGRIFGVPIVCPDGVSGEFTGGFSVQSPFEALEKLTERTGWSVSRQGWGWLLEAPGRTGPPELRWELVKPGASSGAKKSP
jgi:hypothetical protein